MEKKYYLAIDIGASSGRHILGSLEDGKLVLEEVFRFKNGAIEKNGSLVWDIDNLFNSVVEGIAECKKIGKIPCSIGIDTWGVDYALLDKNDKLIGNIFSYRDSRTQKVIDEVYSIIGEKELYSITGIKKQVFNTIFQLYSDKKTGKIDNAETFLMVPDYLHFLLTGVKKNEYTNASTTGLLDAKTKSWSFDIIDKLGLKKELFKPLSEPTELVGELSPEIAERVGFKANVYLPATHDTASAVMAVPKTNGTPLYISSGTWSLIGIESPVPNTSKDADKAGYSNEGGYNSTIRFLKNIMGLWMIQNIKKEYNDAYSFSEFVDEAKKTGEFESILDVDDLSFFAPDSMIKAVKDFCAKTGQKVPETVGEIVLCVYQSLAKGYKDAVDKLENISGRSFDTINIVGGGCQNKMLNELTAKWTGKTVVTGPIEATAVGNLIAQAMAIGDIKDIVSARETIKRSFDIETLG